MNRNLLKQIWNERRSNAFLWMELFVVFIILWYIVDVVYVTLSIYNLPMGFDIENTYVLRFERMTSKAAAYQPGRTMKEDVADLHEIVNRLAHRPDVEAVSLSQNCIPYNDGANSFSFYLDTVPVRSLKRWITPEYFNVFRYRNIDGSGSESLAEALTPSGMVLSVNIADVYQDAPWHGKELLGRRVPVWRNEPEAEHLSIAALTEPVRYDHFTAPDDYGSRYAAVYLTDEALESLGETVYIEVCLRVREGQNDGFIDRLIVDADRQYQVGNLYLLDITPLSDVRTAYETDSVNELNTQFCIIFFLLLNIFLGIIGTFWFRTQHRRAEIALRMALGSTRWGIVYQDAPWHGKELLGRRVPVWRNEPEAEHLSIAALTEPVRYDHFTAPDDYGSRYAAVYLTDEALESLGETVYIEVCLRVREGQNDGFIDRLIVDADRQYQVGNLYLLDITPLSDVRTAYETDSVNELNTQFCIIFFLLLNIFLGIIGTFWFRTQHRRAEIALRMALGSTRWGICGRLMGEGVLLLLISAIPALVVAWNLGYAELVEVTRMPFTAGRFAITVLGTFILIAGMIVIGIGYPARRAMSIEPAEALHEE